MKVLCMCQGGNSRSVGCAFLLKYTYGIDALSCSWEKNSAETLDMLFGWADHIIVMEEHFQKYIPRDFKDKLIIVDVGPDIWCNGLHPGLLTILGTKLQPMLVPVAEMKP